MANELEEGLNHSDEPKSAEPCEESNDTLKPVDRFQQAKSLAKCRISEYKKVLDNLKKADEVTKEKRVSIKDMQKQCDRLQRWAEDAGVFSDKTSILKYDFRNITQSEQFSVVRILRDLEFDIGQLPRLSEKIEEIRNTIDDLERFVKPSTTDRSFRTSYRSCVAAYAVLCDRLDKSRKDVKEILPRETIVQKHGSLTGWAERTGLLLEGEASLEEKLRKAPDRSLVPRITEVLRAIQSILHWIIDTLPGENTSYEVIPSLRSNAISGSMSQRVSTEGRSSTPQLVTALEEHLDLLTGFHKLLWTVPRVADSLA